MKKLQISLVFALCALGSGTVWSDWSDSEHTTTDQSRPRVPNETEYVGQEYGVHQAEQRARMGRAQQGQTWFDSHTAGRQATVGSDSRSRGSQPDVIVGPGGIRSTGSNNDATGNDTGTRDRQATTSDDVLADDFDEVDKNIKKRVDSKSLVLDPEGYRDEIRKKLEEYADEISEVVQPPELSDNQKATLKKALSEGLLKDPEMINSIGDVILGGLSVAGDFVQAAASPLIGGYGRSGRSLKGDSMDIARATDFRSTSKRLSDVITHGDMQNLLTKLKLTKEQRGKLEDYRNRIVNSFDHQAREFYDDVRENIARVVYRGAVGAIMALMAALIITVIVEGATHS